MLIYIFFMNLFFSSIFIFLNHPLSLGGILLIQTIMMSLASGFFFYNFWFSYILFLVMIGGMLVLFIYMTSIASNEKFTMPKLFMITAKSVFLMILLILLFKDNFLSNILNLMLNNFSIFKKILNFSLNKYFNFPGMPMMISLMIYLFVTLIAIVKITGKNLGPLRQK